MRFPDSYIDEGNPWTTDTECCAWCGTNTERFVWIDNEPMCEECEHFED